MNLWVVLYRSSWVALAILAIVLLISVFVPQISEYHTLRDKTDTLEEEIRLEEQILSPPEAPARAAPV